MTTKILFGFLIIVCLAGLLSACKDEAPPSLYDSNYSSGPQPTIAQIGPTTDALAGVTTVTITGSNFSSTPGNNLVFFDATPASVLQATSTQLQVKAPLLVSDTIKVKVAVMGSDLFSSPFQYKLASATEVKFGNVSQAEEVVSLECDAAGNVYASMLSSGAGFGVWKFTPAGVRGALAYSPAFSPTVASWRGMKFGPAGVLYCVAGRNIIFQIPAGGGTSAAWLVGSGLTSLNDLDFDQNANIWAGGPLPNPLVSANNVFRVKQDKSVKAFPFAGLIRSVRVYNNYLYIGAKRDSLDKVWRLPIIGDSLGAEEEYFSVSSVYGPNTSGVFGIAFNTDGDMYVGTDAAAGILLVHPTGASESYYSGLLSASTAYLTWGTGTNLFQARTSLTVAKTIVRINTLKTSAPYYGRTLP